MSNYLPDGGFKWLKNVNGFDGNSIGKKSSIGYILENDLEYSDKLRVLHNDYPLALEKLAISFKMLLDYCKEIADKYEIKVGDKANYVCSCRNLQLYLFLGMKLKKIHRVLKFNHSDWMKNCTDFNTEKTTNAANSFGKYFFKLMIISVYGKTMENLN